MIKLNKIVNVRYNQFNPRFIDLLIINTIFISLSHLCFGVIFINDLADLRKIGNDSSYPMNGEYELTQNIDASETRLWNNNSGFIPIGSYTNPFAGKLNGKGFKISGLYINRNTDNNVGLFGSLCYGARIENITLENVNITGNSTVGGLVGLNYGSIINCAIASGSVTGNVEVGGLTGNNTSYGNIEKSFSSATVNGKTMVGGLVGMNRGKILQSYTTALVRGLTNSSMGGGLIGWNEGTVSLCYSMSDVSISTYSGGFVGFTFGSSTIKDCYSLGRVIGDKQIGGFVGQLKEGSVINSYSITEVMGNSDVGGFAASKDTGTIEHCYWDIDRSLQTVSAGGEGKVSSELMKKVTYINWDFTNVWRILENSMYPFLFWETNRSLQVPNLQGKTEIVAYNTLVSSGFDVEIKRECNNSVSKDLVISHTPSYGQQVNVGAKISLTVSSGPCFMPNVVGMLLTEAINLLNEFGLVIETEVKCNDTKQYDTVVYQSIPPGVEIAQGIKVKLTVSSGICITVDMLIQELKVKFDEIDLNKDGEIDWQEIIQKYPNLSADVFSAVDKNKNGTIDKQEVTSAQTPQTPQTPSSCFCGCCSKSLYFINNSSWVKFLLDACFICLILLGLSGSQKLRNYGKN